MSKNPSGNPVRTARGVVGLIAALMVMGPALTAVAGHDLPERGTAGTTEVLATNAGPATPPVSS
ncbi:hypothetical protein ACFYYR_24200 [Streptomyces sp. NPDC001922]|uniref:hypothetical protein n=1 Tax=Streptomyces sp. NPDC001922 TaxID=3364624 RepID=UPI003686EB35